MVAKKDDITKGGSLISVTQVCKILDVPHDFVRLWINKGLIPVGELRRHRKSGLKKEMFYRAQIEALKDRKDEWLAAPGLVPKTERRRRLTADREAFRELVAKAGGFDDYPALFPLARGMRRRLVFLSGPTNSGKTHEALRMVSEAATGEVLSPLRLLALEHYQALRDMDVDCGLVTGEERILVDDPTHVARTIETADFYRRVDVAVVDEIQMLDDRDRGWAWTAAVIGIPANVVVMTGAAEALPMVQKIAEMTGDELEVRHFERKTPLLAMDREVDLMDVRPGDAVILFSRRDVHECRKILTEIGAVTTAVLYGALGPEVRKAEAARFVDGRADVLIATDAIGMGLNLGGIARVLFATTAKFDGAVRRQLNTMEIRQIGGRAGRFGRSEKGMVGTVRFPGMKADLRLVQERLNAEHKIKRSRLLVRPTFEIVAVAAAHMGVDRLADVLEYLAKNLAQGDDRLQVADMGEMITLAKLVDNLVLPLEDKFVFACAPVDSRSDIVRPAFERFARGRASKVEMPCPRFGSAEHAALAINEQSAKVASLYLWLAYKFPDTFVDLQGAINTRQKVQAAIEAQLSSAAGKRIDLSAKERKKRQEKFFADRSAGRDRPGFFKRIGRFRAARAGA
ncbi:helicase-related protein [Rhizobium leguminosarum]|uniref:helicase-related protein n=1 Tax=Rhizobium leguminosarum TaxID=384 RepID=UPI002E12CFFE|nr:helicase-related protein [Rhizobium leguminosarum]